MKIKLLRNTGIDGKHTIAGTIVDVTPSLARDFIASGRAIVATDDEPAEVESETEGTAPFPGDDTLEGTEPEGDEPEDAPAPKPSRAKK